MASKLPISRPAVCFESKKNPARNAGIIAVSLNVQENGFVTFNRDLCATSSTPSDPTV